MGELKRRGLAVANRCFLYLEEEEIVDHILLHCGKSQDFMISSWHGAHVSKKRKKVWQVALLCLFWTTWKERNDRAFDNNEHSIQRLRQSFICNLWAWTRLHIAPTALTI